MKYTIWAKLWEQRIRYVCSVQLYRRLLLRSLLPASLRNWFCSEIKRRKEWEHEADEKSIIISVFNITANRNHHYYYTWSVGIHCIYLRIDKKVRAQILKEALPAVLLSSQEKKTLRLGRPQTLFSSIKAKLLNTILFFFFYFNGRAASALVPDKIAKCRSPASLKELTSFFLLATPSSIA